ncbi:MAG: sulfotransferase [Ignavibacteriae bacterium]|nr:sulfotransferase [Ignavibacteriota bacterium]
MKKVSFIGVGPPKTGTTWIADNLRSHPDVFIPKTKELHYFNSHQHYYKDIVNKKREYPISWYHSFFKKSKEYQLWGELSVSYFEFENCAKDIFNYNSDCKIIISIREPISKSLSYFQYLIQKGLCTPNLDFEQFVSENDYLLMNSMYYDGISRFLKYFPKEQIIITVFDNLVNDNKKFFKQILEFLNLKEYYPPDIDKSSNEAKTIKNPFFGKLIMGSREFLHKNDFHWLLPVLKISGITPLAEYIRDNVNEKKIEMKAHISADFRHKLKKYFIEDIEKTESLINIDLSNWK